MARGDEYDVVWAINVERKNGRISGELARDENGWRSTNRGERGQRVVIDPERIADWLYLRDGKIMGNFTLRVLLPKMPPEQAAQLKARLWPLPQ